MTNEEELNKAAEEYFQNVKAKFLRTLEHPTAKDCFIAGAKWAMEQGVTIDGCVTVIANERWLDIDDDRADEVLSKFHNDEKVIVQIRKKHE